NERNTAVTIACSGIKDTLIEGGATAHSAIKLPLKLNVSKSTLYNLSKQREGPMPPEEVFTKEVLRL
ncbi:hypothetical protein AVEN_160157-1, partial [Araneus ventricosus]